MRKVIVLILMLTGLNIFAQSVDVRKMNMKSVHNTIDSIEDIIFMGAKKEEYGVVEVYRSKYLSFTFAYDHTGKVRMIVIGDENQEDTDLILINMLSFIHSGVWVKGVGNKYHCDGLTATYDPKEHAVWCMVK